MVGGTLILLLQAAPLRAYPPVWFYYLNYSSGVEGVKHISHFWSLCVEMHFYLFVGLLVGMLGRRGLLALPLLAAAITLWRIKDGVYINVNTHYRVDKICAGAAIALCYGERFGRARHEDRAGNWSCSAADLARAVRGVLPPCIRAGEIF